MFINLKSSKICKFIGFYFPPKLRCLALISRGRQYVMALNYEGIVIWKYLVLLIIQHNRKYLHKRKAKRIKSLIFLKQISKIFVLSFIRNRYFIIQYFFQTHNFCKNWLREHEKKTKFTIFLTNDIKWYQLDKEEKEIMLLNFNG